MKTDLSFRSLLLMMLIGLTSQLTNGQNIKNTPPPPTPPPPPQFSVSFASTFLTVSEGSPVLNVIVNITKLFAEEVNDGQFKLILKDAPFNTADSNDFTFTSQSVTFSANETTKTIAIPINDDAISEQQAEYFVLGLDFDSKTTNDYTVNTNVGTNSMSTIYIKDNDKVANTPNNDIALNLVGSFDPSGANASTCEIVVHDAATQRLFSISAVAKKLDIINFANPNSLSTISSIDMAPYGGITSVAVKNGIVAVSAPNANEQLNGSVVFFDTNGNFIKQVTVGALPDMITFTPDGTKVMTANEGQPNAAYTVDPEGSISIIDITGGVANLTQTNVTTLDFTHLNAQETALMASGIRKVRATSTLSQDIEPEYITINSTSTKAWVALQENNAIAEIDLTNSTMTSVWALGTKDMSIPGNGFDISDNNGQVLIANWPIKTFYTPDGIASYSVNGTNYIVTANEGDEKDYTGYSERTTVGASTLDAVSFPNGTMLKQSFNAGRYRITKANGNTDADAEYEQLYGMGSRSFSIFNADTKAIVFDSGDDFEMFTANYSATLFNTDHESNALKNRSRSKGPEPEGVTVGQINGKTFAFISLERFGGVMVYDVTDPNNVKFVDFKTGRNMSAYGGDNGPEGITFIKAANSPNSKNYVLVANEISGTLSVFEVNANKIIATTKVRTAHCGTTLIDMNSIIYADLVTGSQAYRFEISNGGVTKTFDSTSNKFKFAQITSGVLYNTPYSVRVAVKIDGTWGAYGEACIITTPAAAQTTKVTSSQCNSTLLKYDSRIYADPKGVAQSFKFEVTYNGNSRSYETNTGNTYSFKLSYLGSFVPYNATASVKVAIKENGIYGEYGDACNITTPAIVPTTKIQNSQCDTTLPLYATRIYCDFVPGVSMYKFEVTHNGTTRTFESTSNSFRLKNFPGFVGFNASFTVRVAVKNNNVYGDYGTTCTISTGAAKYNETMDDDLEEETFTLASYPNPFANSFHLDFRSTSNNEVNVMVYDMLGKQIENRSFNALEVYNQTFGTNYATGVYNVMVSQNGTTKTVRVIKN